jgi:hypothetical protein
MAGAIARGLRALVTPCGVNFSISRSVAIELTAMLAR